VFVEPVDPEEHDELNVVEVWTEYTNAVAVTVTSISIVREMNCVFPCPEVTLPKMVDSDFQKEDANAEIRKDAEGDTWLDPNIEPNTRIRELPEAAPDVASVPFTIVRSAINNDCSCKHPCPKVTVTFFPAMDTLGALSETELEEIQSETSEDECPNLDDTLISVPGKFFPISIINLDPVNTGAPSESEDVGTSKKAAEPFLVR